LGLLAKTIGDDPAPQDGNAPRRAIDYALRHEFERKSVVPERTVFATALKQSVGQATVEEVLTAARRSDLVTGERQGRRIATTLEVLLEEKQVIEFAREGRGTCRPFVSDAQPVKRDWLNRDQQAAVRHVLESRDRVMILRGAAGVGKTTLVKEAVE